MSLCDVLFIVYFIIICESYDVKRETVHCYPVNSSLLAAVARDGWNLSAVFKSCFVLLYNKSLNDWSLGTQ